ncbi:DUF982 domain-containing protein [Bosea sp. F3-2]|uniref:DUF982 domain-containing protein n=1 Tax=Bosea sp. F3-2 TaxID=2599640 RepID=UPI0011F03A17|nr:DUF982 domain-containing protein [Bosea sp. F3-2]QEL26176.1 DUF982 domain-containing protein [Bosea sp. F3-2]
MPRLWFDPPVSIEGDRPGLTIVISSVERAAEQLLTWEDRGPKWRGAVQACMDAMSGGGTAKQAREAFVTAAEEVGKLL